jgi:hypothetical protein
VLVAALLWVGTLVLLRVVNLLAPAAVPFRVLAMLVCLGPLAFAMGMPFALGVRQLTPRGGALAWAWASNGFASVAAAPLSALLLLELGSRVLLVVAGAAYAGAAILSLVAGRGRRRELRPSSPRWRGLPRQPSSPLESRLSIVGELGSRSYR